jgi:hypothetical protein
MDAMPSGARISRAWQRCGLCGRYFSFPKWDRAPRDCEDCGAARQVSAPPISVRRLRLMGE